MDFAFFAIAFNLKKMCKKMENQGQNGGNSPQNGPYILILTILTSENRKFWENPTKISRLKIPRSSDGIFYHKRLFSLSRLFFLFVILFLGLSFCEFIKSLTHKEIIP